MLFSANGAVSAADESAKRLLAGVGDTRAGFSAGRIGM
jgi:hypothetical protein